MMTANNLKLKNLLIYRSLLNDEIVKTIQLALGQNSSESIHYELYSQLIHKAEQLTIHGNLFNNYLVYLMSKDENLFSKTAEKLNGRLDCNSSLYQAVLHDIKIIKSFAVNELHALAEKAGNELIRDFVPTVSNGLAAYNPALQTLADKIEADTPEQLAAQLADYYFRYGSGIMSDFRAFRWSSNAGLTGIKNCDKIRLQDITGYERQKAILVENTCAFIANKPANNILLMGSPGTGKSTSVKALINEEFAKNLRLVEVSKQELHSLPALLDKLRNHCQKFIIFLDDLSFEEFEIEYKYLKSMIDGGIEVTPSNVLIYATSNRMHLVKENWNDRKGDSDDVHRFDTLNEKLSLADRFGITLTYLSPNQVEYFTIVEQLAIKNNIQLPLEQLKAEALKWERQHNGRSGRTGQQFINHLLCHQ